MLPCYLKGVAQPLEPCPSFLFIATGASTMVMAGSYAPLSPFYSLVTPQNSYTFYPPYPVHTLFCPPKCNPRYTTGYKSALLNYHTSHLVNGYLALTFLIAMVLLMYIETESQTQPTSGKDNQAHFSSKGKGYENTNTKQRRKHERKITHSV